MCVVSLTRMPWIREDSIGAENQRADTAAPFPHMAPGYHVGALLASEGKRTPARFFDFAALGDVY